MKRLIPLLLWLFSLSQNANGAENPEALVKSFQTDYLSWNNYAIKIDSNHEPIKSMELIEESYKKLLIKYTLPEFKGEPVAYSTEPSHDPHNERIISTQLNGNSATIRTELLHSAYYTPVYEYHLINKDGRWYLTQVYVIDSDGQYPCL
ncbi:MAG: hypothetical protein ACRC61_07120 [Aeromonas salmonicida]